MKKIGISKNMARGIFAVLIIALATTLVSAGLLNYFGEVQTTMNVSQSVTIDGNDWDDPITQSIPDAVGGCCYCFEYEVTNNGCEGIDLTFDGGSGLPDGVYFKFFEQGQSCCTHILDSLDIKVLDGIADDSFDVYVDGTLVCSYPNGDPIVDPETWSVHNIDLTTFQIPCCGTHKIRIDATGAQWASWGTYGQLGVDTISLFCEPDTPGGPKILCDSVDMGKTASEAGHNIFDWGPIEPSTSGGNWGGIDDCRAVWTSSDQYTYAEVDLTCADCYEPCDCEDRCDETGLEYFHLGPGESIDLCLCYKLDMMIIPGDYVITTYLLPYP